MENTNYSSELSSTIFSLTSSIDTLTKAVSGLYQHPFECVKKLYFDEDYVFPNINEINVPEYVTPEILIRSFEQKHLEYQETVLSYLSNPASYDLREANNQLNLLCTLSTDNKFVMPIDKYSNYISTLETLQNIPLDTVTDENSSELALKIGYLINRAFVV